MIITKPRNVSAELRPLGLGQPNPAYAWLVASLRRLRHDPLAKALDVGSAMILILRCQMQRWIEGGQDGTVRRAPPETW